MAGLFDDLLVEGKPDLPVIPSGSLRPTTYGPGSPNPTPADLRERIGHADNPLKEGDVALQPETAKQYGLKTGDKFVYQGQVFNYADTPAPRVGKVIDVYHPSPTASPKGGSTGLFSDIITPTPTPSETPEPAKNAGMFQDIVDDADADRTPPPINIPQSTPSAVPSPDEALGPHEPSWIEKTGRAAAKYVKQMVPTSGEQLAGMMHIPTDFSQPEELARLLMPPPAQGALDLIKQTQTRMTEIQNADQTPAYSQERFDAGIATALDILGIGGGAEGVAKMASMRRIGSVARPEPAVPPPPGTAGAALPPMPNAAVGPQVAPATGGPIPIVTAAEREGIMYGGESKGLTPDDLAALDELASPISQPERIASAAYKLGSDVVDQGGIHGPMPKGAEAGFLTDKGRFVGREEAFQLAKRNKQAPEEFIKEEESRASDEGKKPELLAEDLTPPTVPPTPPTGGPVEIVGYHGTRQAFDQFSETAPVVHRKTDRPAFYFTTKEAAHQYTNRGKGQRRVVEARLKFQNPLDITDDVAAFQKQGLSFGDAKRRALDKLSPYHDGFIFRGDDLNPPEYAVFRSDQITQGPPPTPPTTEGQQGSPAPRRPTEKSVTMKVRPLQQLRRQLAAAEKAGEAGFRRGSREARQQAEQAAAIEARMVKDTVNTVDNWMAQDVEDLRKSLISFSRHLPLHERGKFIPAITKAIKKPAIYSKDPGVLQRRAASLMDRMTEAIYNQNKREVQGKIGKLLQKIEDSPSIILSQKRIAQQIRRTFENLKDKMSLEMLERMLSNLKWQEAHGRDLFHLSKTIEDQRREFAIGEIEAQGTRKSDTPQQALLPLGDVETMWQRATAAMARDKHKIQRFQMAIKPMDWVFQLFDQRQWGKLWEHLKAPVDIQYGQFLDAADVYKKRLTSILDKYKLDEGNLRRIYAHAEYRQEGGEANLKARGYTNADIAKIKNVGQLSKAERAYLRESDKILNEMYPAIKDVLEKFYNQELPNIPNYFPRIRDWDHYNSLSIEEGKFAEAYRRTNTKDGFTKERQGAVTKNLDNAHEVMMNHIDDAVYHMTMGPTIKRIANIVRDDRFKNVTGSFGQQLFADYVDVLARNGGEGSGRRIGWMDTLRKNMGVAQLAFRLTTTFLQPTQLIQAMPYLGKGNLARTLSEFGSRANQEWILKNFPEVKHRMTDDPAGMGYTRKTIRDRAARAGFHLISDWDRKAAMAVAETAYRDALERRGIAFDRTAALHMQAYAEAMNIVRKTQASPFTKDVPLALSGGKFAGNKSLNQAIFQFQNFTMNRWAMIEGDALQMGIKDKNWRRAAKVTSWLIVATAAEQMLREGIANGLRTILGTTDSEQQRLSADQEKSAAQLILERGATDLAFTMPILSNAAGMYRYDSSGVPIADTLMDVVKGARSFFRGKKGETKAAGAIRLAQGVGGATGLPTGQAGDILSRLIRGTANVQQGPTEGFYPLAPPPPPPPPPPPAY